MKIVKIRPEKEALIINKGATVYVIANLKPRDYVWDFKDATPQEMSYFKRCIDANKWLKQ